ncbi:MAG: DUF4286 family protein [Gammaproteobacteria bacterium]|nr:DUF4286 family protein [Gammaproteobacteria bacterium]
MTGEGLPERIIHEVDCTLDPDIVAEFDAWLPGHVRAVLACAGLLAAAIQVPEIAPGEPRRRRVLFELESEAALDQYLENDAPRLRSDAEQRFGAKLYCERRKYRQREALTAVAAAAPRCDNCAAPVPGTFCAHCGQSRDTHVPALRELAGDVTHSLLHLDGRVWRTLRTLLCAPGELTRAWIAGRRQQFLPPFRLYLAASILFFALSALLPQPEVVAIPAAGQAPAPAGEPPATAALASAGVTCDFRIALPLLQALEAPLQRACGRIRADGGRQLLADFTANAPKVMFVFLPLLAAVAVPFYRRARRRYVEHLVLFLHNHTLVFLGLAGTNLLDALALAAAPLAWLAELVSAAVLLWLAWYVFRSLRVVYGEGWWRTLAKFSALALLYLLLLGATMAGAMLYTLLRLA